MRRVKTRLPEVATPMRRVKTRPTKSCPACASLRYPRATLGALRARQVSVAGGYRQCRRRGSRYSRARLHSLAADTRNAGRKPVECRAQLKKPCGRACRALRATLLSLARKYREACAQGSAALRLGIGILARLHKAASPGVDRVIQGEAASTEQVRGQSALSLRPTLSKAGYGSGFAGPGFTTPSRFLSAGPRFASEHRQLGGERTPEGGPRFAAGDIGGEVRIFVQQP